MTEDSVVAPVDEQMVALYLVEDRSIERTSRRLEPSIARSVVRIGGLGVVNLRPFTIIGASLLFMSCPQFAAWMNLIRASFGASGGSRKRSLLRGGRLVLHLYCRDGWSKSFETIGWGMSNLGFVCLKFLDEAGSPAIHGSLYMDQYVAFGCSAEERERPLASQYRSFCHWMRLRSRAIGSGELHLHLAFSDLPFTLRLRKDAIPHPPRRIYYFFFHNEQLNTSATIDYPRRTFHGVLPNTSAAAPS